MPPMHSPSLPASAVSPFPPGFRWGAATAAYQIEGASTADGKGDSVWDMFCRQPGRVSDGSTGDQACDHYHRHAEDVGLMREHSLRAYRFSVSWPRVLPSGTGAVNAVGLGFYDRLVDELLAAGVEPWLTLFHWDLPHELYLRGGWLNPDSPRWFADYAALLGSRLGDRVRHWFTLNEPQCFIGLGHRDGSQAPGDRLGWAEVLRAGHHALLAHGRAVQALRAACPLPPQVGYAPAGAGCVPASDAPADVAAARHAAFAVPEPGFWNNAWWMDPVFLGHYPEEGLRTFGADAPRPAPGDLELIRQPLDFFGVNLYNADVWAADPASGAPRKIAPPPGTPRTAVGWGLAPTVLRYMPRFYHERYGLPVVVAENGMAGADWVGLDGEVADHARIDYMRRYLRELAKAGADGVPLLGYFVWSWMDNFEWSSGHTPRFGLVHVDYATQRRTPKASARWYRELIRADGAGLF